ncbi:MAG: hypothetical protein JXB47_13720 [Anaerolineae bacterium]|nr:hypothetical protein [Anaerolineae bacterium]
MQTVRTALVRRAPMLSLAWVGVWALALYLYILPLPFFRDDMVMLLWLRDMDWGRLWVDATGFLYYRPLSFSTLKLSELFFGYYHAPFLHLVTLFFHTASAVMVAALARFVLAPSSSSEGKGNTAAGVAAGMLFAAYPFTYEVMPTTGPIFQLQAAFFGLATALAYAKWRTGAPRARLWLYLTLALALMGAFTCEYGVIIPAMVGLVEALLWARGAEGTAARERRRLPDLRVPLLCLGFTALYLALWLIVPKTRSADLPFIWLRELDLKGLYYFQGLTYPFQWLALPIERLFDPARLTRPGVSPDQWSWAVLAIGAATLAAAVVVYIRRRRGGALLFGLALWALAVLPTLVTLQWDYTWNGPRLLYLPAIGAAVLLGGALGLLAERGGVSRALGAAVLVLTLAQSVLFLRGQAAMMQTGGQAVDDTAALAALPEGESALVVNFPSWLRPRAYTYVLGAEGISFLPAYSTAADLVELNRRAVRDVTNVTFTNLWNPWRYDQRFYTPPLDWDELLPAVRQADHVFLFQFDDAGAHLREAGHVAPAAPGDPGAVAVFGAAARLDAVNWTLSGSQLALALDWTALDTPGRDWTVFVHVYGEADAPLAQHDGYPLLGLLPLWAWTPGEQIHDLRYVDLPPDLAPGAYRVALGVYDANTGERAAPGAVRLFTFDYPF